MNTQHTHKGLCVHSMSSCLLHVTTLFVETQRTHSLGQPNSGSNKNAASVESLAPISSLHTSTLAAHSQQHNQKGSCGEVYPSHVQYIRMYVCKPRSAYLRHYPLAAISPLLLMYTNNLPTYIHTWGVKCIKLPTTHLRQVPSPAKIVGVNKSL